MKYIILFNCKNNENDKKWLFDIFDEHGLDVNIIEPKIKIHKLLFLSGLLGRVKYMFAILDQVIRAYRKSGRGYVIIVWHPIGGYFLNLFNMLTGNKRKLILMNWLTPKPTKFYWKFLMKLAAGNDKSCKIIVNSLKSIEQWQRFLKVKDTKNFRFIPDIYDTSIPFLKPQKRTDSYVFTGGFTNRDWKLLMNIADKMQDIKFVCVGLEKIINEEVENPPDNVEIYFQLPSDQYYKLMERATVVALPLKNDWVSGFINITRAAQNGQLCCCTDFSHVEIYYPTERKCDLVQNTVEAWTKQIRNIFSMDADEYVRQAGIFQKHILENFSPDRAFDTLYNCWR